MAANLEVFTDGTGRAARPIQERIILDVLEALETHDVVGINAPPGVGKSFIARCLQMRFPPADIVTPSNNLIDQMTATYPVLNAVKGKDHYDSESEWRNARAEARKKTPSIFNFMSYMVNRSSGLREPALLIIDEAHTVPDILLDQCSTFLPRHRAGLPDTIRSEWDIVEWVHQRRRRLMEALKKDPGNDLIAAQLGRIGDLAAAIQDGRDRETTFTVTEQVSNEGGKPVPGIRISPVRLSPAIVKERLAAGKLVVMSGTLTPTTGQTLAAGRSYKHLSYPYLAAPSNRPVYYTPVPEELRGDVKVLAAAVRNIYRYEDCQPTLVHVNYGNQRLFAEELEDLKPLVNNQRNKSQIEKQFRVRGGIWLAAGAAEGIDLADEACRVVIIPTLLFPDRSSPYVAKRRGMPDGTKWYGLKTLENTIQRLGRGVRHENDSCSSYILDPYWSRLYSEHEAEFEPLNMVWGANE